MKIYRPLHILSGDLWGGAEAQVYLLCKNIVESGREDIVPSALLFNSGVLSNKLEKVQVPTKVSNEKLGFTRLLIDTYKFSEQQNTNLIISHGYKEGFIGFVISKLLCLPWVHFIHGTSENYSGLKKYKMAIYGAIDKFLMRASASRIVGVSKKIGSDLELNHLSKYRVIYNSAEIGTKEQNNENKSYIAWLGRLSPIKRPDLAVMGFKYFQEKSGDLNPSITLEIFGTGPLEGEIRGLTKGSSNINLSGFTDEPIKKISESSLLLLTSDSEGIPTVILEAMHAGIPIVSRMVGGIPEIKSILPNYPIVPIKDNSIEATGLAIQHALENLNELKAKALECNTDFFGVNRLIEDHLNLYKEIA